MSTSMDSMLQEEDVPSVRLSDPIDVGAIMKNEGAEFVINYDANFDKEEEKFAYSFEEMSLHENWGCCGAVQDEDSYDDPSEPFELIAKKMTDVLPNGMVKKRILREGRGEVVPEKSVVTVDYNAYLEYNEEPFDSTYLRKRQHVFRLGEGLVLVGLDVGIATMKLGEKSQFLCTPEVAYGKMGCLERVPPEATVLFEIELLKFVDSGATVTFDRLPLDEQKKFASIYNHALALCAKGNDLVTTRSHHKAAVKEYNTAVGALEFATLVDYDEQEQQQKLLLRLYTNLAVCYMKMDVPKKCCVNCNKIYHMCTGTNLVVPAKVYYNNAKALIALGDLHMAEKRLRNAAEVNRDCPEIVRLFLQLDKLKQEKKERDQRFGKAVVGSLIGKDVELSFKNAFQDLCNDFKDKDLTEVDLPGQLSPAEKAFVEAEAGKMHFKVRFTVGADGSEKVLLTKPDK